MNNLEEGGECPSGFRIDGNAVWPQQKLFLTQVKSRKKKYWRPAFPAVMNTVRTALCLSASFISADISAEVGQRREGEAYEMK